MATPIPPVVDDTTVEVQAYYLPPTDLIPNSPRPLLQYKNVLPPRTRPRTAAAAATAAAEVKAEYGVAASSRTPPDHRDPLQAWDLFRAHGWDTAWIVRYGYTQAAHFHSDVHECMAVLSGAATIRFGLADTADDLAANTDGAAWETRPGWGVTLEARAGDVFVIPAGVAHKTHRPRPAAPLASQPGGDPNSVRLLTPGNGHGIAAADVRRAVADVELSGFTMLGAYYGGRDWDFVRRGGPYEKPWAVPKPAADPVLGRSPRGLVGLWPGRTGHPDDDGDGGMETDEAVIPGGQEEEENEKKKPQEEAAAVGKGDIVAAQPLRGPIGQPVLRSRL